MSAQTVTVSGGTRPVTGRTTVPADKSISHRALIIGCLCRGGTRITNLLDSEDITSTKNALRLLGARIETSAGETTAVCENFSPAGKAVDAGNSGTTARLLAGVLCALDFESTVTGDRYLKRRPMERVIKPLSLMGANISSRGGKLPLSIRGSKLRAMEYELPVASAQVKSAILLAGLKADGDTKITEPQKTRDHTEIMLKHFGAEIGREGNTITLKKGGAEKLEGGKIDVPADISSAIFPVAAAVINPGSRLVIENVGINPARTGGLEILQKMGADIRVSNRGKSGGEQVADIEARGGSPLKGVEIGGDLIPRAIDELPAVAAVACFAQGKTTISDAAELRVKESDRIKSMTEGLAKLGASVEETADGMRVSGGGLAGGACSSAGDHRVAMALGVAATAADGDSEIEDAGCAAISFRDFFPFLEGLRARK